MYILVVWWILFKYAYKENDFIDEIKNNIKLRWTFILWEKNTLKFNGSIIRQLDTWNNHQQPTNYKLNNELRDHKTLPLCPYKIQNLQ